MDGPSEDGFSVLGVGVAWVRASAAGVLGVGVVRAGAATAGLASGPIRSTTTVAAAAAARAADTSGNLMDVATDPGPDATAPGAGATADRADAAVDWDGLRAAAVQAASAAYAPYSGLAVGAAGRCADGRVVTGCNVENASYGLALCAECTMAGQLRLTGGGRLVAVACRSASGRLLTPCGRCRQILVELGGPACLVDTPHGAVPLAELLPDAFTLPP